LSSGQLLVINVKRQFHIMDTSTGGSMKSFPVHLDIPHHHSASVVAVSSTGQVMVVADTAGTLHHYATSPTATFNEQSYATTFAAPAPRQPYADIDDPAFAMACVSFNAPPGGLLSNDDGVTNLKKVVRRRPQLDPTILSNLKISDFIGYSPNRTRLKANRNPYVSAMFANLRGEASMCCVGVACVLRGGWK
jgi:hypothetical protein